MDHTGDPKEEVEGCSRSGINELELLLEEYDRNSNKVSFLKELVNRKTDEEAEDNEEVSEEKKWTKDKAEALHVANGVEDEYKKGEKTASAVIKGVQNYLQGAHKTVTDKKYGQQNWGLFETNYQREKGLTLDESLDEIERFQKHGELPEHQKRNQAPREAGAFEVRQKLEQNLQNDRSKGSKPLSHPGFGGPKGVNASSQGETPRMNGETNRHLDSDDAATTKRKQNKAISDFANNLKNGGDEGSKFFEQFQKKQANKYKPAHGM